jgi:hypothetical protein
MVMWPRGEVQVRKTFYDGSNPSMTSKCKYLIAGAKAANIFLTWSRDSRTNIFYQKKELFFLFHFCIDQTHLSVCKLNVYESCTVACWR